MPLCLAPCRYVPRCPAQSEVVLADPAVCSQGCFARPNPALIAAAPSLGATDTSPPSPRHCANISPFFSSLSPHSRRSSCHPCLRSLWVDNILYIYKYITSWWIGLIFFFTFLFLLDCLCQLASQMPGPAPARGSPGHSASSGQLYLPLRGRLHQELFLPGLRRHLPLENRPQTLRLPVGTARRRCCKDSSLLPSPGAAFSSHTSPLLAVDCRDGARGLATSSCCL